MKVKTDRITLLWTCPICNASFRQALAEIVDSGTAVCPDCDADCHLDETVDVADETRRKR
jgi:transcription elongation factor Elf1